MSKLGTYNESRQNRWYFGGLAAAGAACVTHPLELLKVLLQTQKKSLTLSEMVVNIFNREGILGFYSGISASLVRQLTFTMARMGVNDYLKQNISDNNTDNNVDNNVKIQLAIGAGILGILVGMVAEVANVRMQNDMRLPPEKRRNYKHVLDGVGRIIKEEGVTSLYTGLTPNILRGILMTIFTNVVYDGVRSKLLSLGLQDDIGIKMVSSIAAACSATTATQPIDVIKSRMMSATSNEFRSITEVFLFTARQGPRAFYRGYIPALVRAVPHTIIIFSLMEQMRLHFGRLPPIKNK